MSVELLSMVLVQSYDPVLTSPGARFIGSLISATSHFWTTTPLWQQSAYLQYYLDDSAKCNVACGTIPYHKLAMQLIRMLSDHT